MLVLQVYLLLALDACNVLYLDHEPYVFMAHYLLTALENGNARKQDLSAAGQKKTQTNVRILRGHSGAVTALHCVTRREVWDLVGDREDAGFFISGSTDCSVSYYILLIF